MVGMQNEVWLELLDEFEEHIPLFVQTFTGELEARALYDIELVPETDIVRTAHETMHMLLARLRGDDTALTAFAVALGTRRARQGIELKPLVEAIRLDLRIIWQMLLRLAGPERVPVLVQYVELVMELLDEYVDDVQQAFLTEASILQRDSLLATDQHLSRLFNATALTPTLLQEVAQGIGIDPGAEIEVILFTPQESREGSGRKVQHWLAQPNVYGYAYRGWRLLFRALTPEPSTWPKEFTHSSSIYVDRVSGLAAVAAAARASIEFQASAPEITELTYVESLWAPVVEAHLDTLIPGYFRALLSGVEQLTGEERERVTETVLSFLESGSIKQTSEVMTCHRNTVVNRLRLFHELTGLDVSLPKQAALAVILLSRTPHWSFA